MCVVIVENGWDLVVSRDVDDADDDDVDDHDDGLMIYIAFHVAHRYIEYYSGYRSKSLRSTHCIHSRVVFTLPYINGLARVAHTHAVLKHTHTHTHANTHTHSYIHSRTIHTCSLHNSRLSSVDIYFFFSSFLYL